MKELVVKFVKPVGFADRTGTERVRYEVGQWVKVQTEDSSKYLILHVGYVYPNEVWEVE